MENEIEVSFIVPYGPLLNYIENKGWKKLEIQDYYLNPKGRFRVINDSKVVATHKSKEEKLGQRIEHSSEIQTDDSFKKILDECTQLKIEKTRYCNKNRFIDLIHSPMRLGMIEIEFESLKKYEQIIRDAEKLGITLNTLNAWNFFKRRVGFVGGPATGKSSMAKQLSLILNTIYQANSSDVVEYATSFIQKTGRLPTFEDQFLLYQKQKEREDAISRSANIVISDSPIWLSYIYALRSMRERPASPVSNFMLGSLYKRALSAITFYQTLWVLTPMSYRENNIRFHNFEESKEITQQIKDFLADHGCKYLEGTYNDIDRFVKEFLFLNDFKKVVDFLGI